MDGFKQVSLALATAGLLASGAAQAALENRGGGLLYDTELHVTWLEDANYAATQFTATGGAQGDADGRMNWSAANAWAAGLDISRIAGESLKGWRLASNTPVGLDWNYPYAENGSTDFGYNITSKNSELSYMYYVNLGLKGYVSPASDYQPDWGIFVNGTCNGTDCSSYGQKDVGPVKNLQSYIYWSGTAYAPDPATHAWTFNTSYGYQGLDGNLDVEVYAWAVRPGDVAAVPEPEVYALLMAGLGLLGVMTRRRKQQQTSA